MYAIRQYEFGPAEALRFEEVDDPLPEPGEVRIEVKAVGVHFVDTSLRQGLEGGPPLPELPTTPGREVAGVVEALGEGVEDDWLGRRVVTLLGRGAGGYAEFAVSAVEALHLLRDDLEFEVAVAMVGTGRTTMGILDSARLGRDDVMLVTAAAGGIGSLLVQTGRNLGATVVGAAGGRRKVERARESGATFAVDYHDPGWPDAVRQALDGRDVTVVLEGVGGELGRNAMKLLGPGGRLVMFGWASDFGKPTQISGDDLMSRALTATWALGPAMYRRHTLRELEERALAEAASGRLVPAVLMFPLKDAAAAHVALETRATIGKVVLVP